MRAVNAALGVTIGAGIAASAWLTVAVAQPPDIALPPCAYEDGNPDGQPCIWTSPRTGISYYNDGSNYR